MIDSRFVFLSLLVNAAGFAIYVKCVLDGSTRPHPVTWLLWALSPLVAFAVQVGNGVGLPALLTLAVGINPAIVFVLVARRSHERWRVTAFDVVCGLLGLAGILLWVVFEGTDLAIAIAILADAFAAIPTFRKALAHPQTETWAPYAGLAAASLITLATIQTWSFQSYGFAVYLLAVGLSLTAILICGPRSEEVNPDLRREPPRGSRACSAPDKDRVAARG